MGKRKSNINDDDGEPAADSIASLFADDNPFRRKPESQSSILSNTLVKRSHHTDTVEIPSFKKLRIDCDDERDEHNDNHNNKKKNKKRKRDKIEEDYERRSYAAPEDQQEEEEQAATVVGRKRKADELGGKDMVVRGEEPSFDDEGKLLRTVFVGNLPLKTKKKALLKEFAAFGEVDSARIRSVPIADTKAPRKAAIIQGKVNDAIDSVHAYIVFKDEQSARAALAHNMAKFGGNHIRVDMACPPRKKMKGEAPIYSIKKTVFVGNLPFDVKDEELYQLFCDEHKLESSLEAIRVIRDPQTSLGKGIAYVMFKTREAANSVVKKKGIKLRDRELRLSHARSDSTPSKRKTDSRGEIEYPSKRMRDSFGRSDNKPTLKASSLSYEGLHSSKSGMSKRAPRVNLYRNSGTGGSIPSEGKIRKEKRPAVAARKANAQKQTQKKRKQESGMPGNFHRSKKTKYSS